MQEILRKMSLADYRFVVELIGSGVSLADATTLKERLAALEHDSSVDAVAALCQALEREIRYLGSSDAAYLARRALGQEPGVSWAEIVQDAAQALKVSLPSFCDEETKLRELVKQYVGAKFAELEPEKQRKVLAGIGAPPEEIREFFRRSAARMSVPLLLQLFGSTLVERLIADLALNAIAGFAGRSLGKKLLQEAAKRFPLWAEWLGPAAWTASIVWTVADLQGPALRKTIPLVLYLGLVLLRDDEFGD